MFVVQVCRTCDLLWAKVYFFGALVTDGESTIEVCRKPWAAPPDELIRRGKVVNDVTPIP